MPCWAPVTINEELLAFLEPYPALCSTLKEISCKEQPTVLWEFVAKIPELFNATDANHCQQALLSSVAAYTLELLNWPLIFQPLGTHCKNIVYAFVAVVILRMEAFLKSDFEQCSCVATLVYAFAKRFHELLDRLYRYHLDALHPLRKEVVALRPFFHELALLRELKTLATNHLLQKRSNEALDCLENDAIYQLSEALEDIFELRRRLRPLFRCEEAAGRLLGDLRNGTKSIVVTRPCFGAMPVLALIENQSPS
jgi:hypothetical protein